MDDGEGTQDLLREAIFYRLFDEAERVRWRIADIPWGALERDLVTPEMIWLVRETAFSELTTFSASQRFFAEFEQDVDFTQWVTVWMYEETKHPHVLLRWLRELGVTVDAEFMLRGRVTQPLMRSKMGTLVMNIISEMIAAASYLSMTQLREPVLVQIARNLAGDEARHASSFYAYARRRIETSEAPDEERLRALETLFFWFLDKDRVLHPIGELYRRLGGSAFAEGVSATRIDLDQIQTRILAMIGRLVDRPLADRKDLMREIRALSPRRPAPARAQE